MTQRKGNAVETLRHWTRRSAIGGAAALTLAGCVRQRTKALTWWAIAQEGEQAPHLVSPFTKRTGIRVDVQVLPWTGAHQKFLTGFAGNALPDLLMVKNDWLPELAVLGALTPVPAASPLLQGHFPGALRAVVVDGRAIAVPWTIGGWMQFYRTDRLAALGYQRPPQRWDAWWSMAQALKRRFPDSYPTLHLLNWPEPLFAFAAQQSDPLLRDRNARANFSSPGFREALRFYAAIYWEGLSPTILGTEVGDSLLAFREGRFNILPSGADTVGDLNTASLAMPRAQWSVTRTPGPAGPGASFANGLSLAVPASSKRTSQAFALIAHLIAPATAIGLHRLVGDLPAGRAAWTDGDFRADLVAQSFGAQAADSVPPPPIPEWQQVVTEVQRIAELYVRRRFTLEGATNEMNHRVDLILGKRRWLLERGLMT